MALAPVILSPALPSELLTYIIQQETHPTTLIICSSRAEFLAHLVSDMQDTTKGQLQHPGEEPRGAPRANDNRRDALLCSPLYQVAIARHIRMVFVPTVSHLRAYLSIFNHEDSKVPPPPAHAPAHTRRQPLLLVYGLLDLHRDTSEWSAQGISSTASTLIEAARRAGSRAVVVDHPRPPRQSEDGRDGPEDGGGNEVHEADESLLSDEVPVLSASTRRAGADLDDAAWTGRKVALGRVLGRWFRYKRTTWA